MHLCAVASLILVVDYGSAKGSEIEVKEVTSRMMWNDHGSGSNRDFSCWNPEITDGYSMLGSIPHGNYDQPSTAYVLRGQEGVFDSPVGYVQIWNDHGSGSDNDGSFWEPRCNLGYLPVGHYCQAGYSMPSADAMKCVREDLLRPCGYDFVWNDHGSGADTGVSVFFTKDAYITGMQTVPSYTDTLIGVYCLAI